MATILAACWYVQNYALLVVELALLPTWSTFRYDQTPTCLLITQRDKDRPAFFAPFGSELYRSTETELKISLDQGRRIRLDHAAPLDARPTPAQVRSLFTAVGLPLGSSYDDSVIQTIINKALTPSNPYDSAIKIAPVNAA